MDLLLLFLQPHSITCRVWICNCSNHPLLWAHCPSYLFFLRPTKEPSISFPLFLLGGSRLQVCIEAKGNLVALCSVFCYSMNQRHCNIISQSYQDLYSVKSRAVHGSTIQFSTILGVLLLNWDVLLTKTCYYYHVQQSIMIKGVL